MNYDSTAIPDADVPQAAEPIFQNVLSTYASEANKTVSVWRAVPDDLLDFKPHDKTNPIRTILVHQLLSERRFFAQFVGTRSHLPKNSFVPAKGTASRRTARSTSGWCDDGSRSLPVARPSGGSNNALSSAGCSGSGFGSSGDESSTPAITGRRFNRGSDMPGMSQSRPF